MLFAYHSAVISCWVLLCNLPTVQLLYLVGYFLCYLPAVQPLYFVGHFSVICLPFSCHILLGTFCATCICLLFTCDTVLLTFCDFPYRSTAILCWRLSVLFAYRSAIIFCWVRSLLFAYRSAIIFCWVRSL